MRTSVSRRNPRAHLTNKRSVPAVRRAVNLAGGQAELARRSGGGFSQQNVSYWAKHGVPAIKARAVRLAAGGRVSLSSLLGKAS